MIYILNYIGLRMDVSSVPRLYRYELLGENHKICVLGKTVRRTRALCFGEYHKNVCPKADGH